MHDVVLEHVREHRLEDDQIDSAILDRDPDLQRAQCARWVVELTSDVEVPEHRVGMPGRDVLLTQDDAGSDDVESDKGALRTENFDERNRIPSNSAADLEDILAGSNRALTVIGSHVRTRDALPRVSVPTR